MSGDIPLLSPRRWMKNTSLLPVVTCVVGGCALAGSYVLYMCMTKPDISFRPTAWKDDAPWKYVKETESRRLMAYSHPIPTVDPAIAELRKEIGSVKA